MSDTKYTIGLLCKLFNLLLDVKIKVDHFKLAKYDKTNDSVVHILWQILKKLTINCDHNVVYSIKQYMISINYNRSNFLSLPENMLTGSKELLLAIGYILPEKLVELVKEAIKNSPFDKDYDFLNTGLDEFYCPFKTITRLEDIENSMKYLLWLKGKISLNVAQIKEYDLQNKKIANKLKILALKKVNDSNSFNEILAFASKKWFKEYMAKTDILMEILETYTYWKRKEHIFWNWLTTVLTQPSNKI